jgi:hypothetical protein
MNDTTMEAWGSELLAVIGRLEAMSTANLHRENLQLAREFFEAAEYELAVEYVVTAIAGVAVPREIVDLLIRLGAAVGVTADAFPWVAQLVREPTTE